MRRSWRGSSGRSLAPKLWPNSVLPNTDCAVPGLRHEARQQIKRYRPRTFGDAQRIAGVTAADISALLIHATRMEHAQQ